MVVLIHRLIAVAELVLAAALWGFGFIATIWALRVFAAGELVFLRFALAAMLVIPWLFFARGRTNLRREAKLSFLPALLLTMTLLLQTWGLRYTTATKSGFITTLYVVLVPLLERTLAGRHPLSRGMWVCVLSSLVGTALIVNLTQVTTMNFGDVLTFLCALFAAGQIFYLGVVSPHVQHPFVFNLTQAFWSLLICAPLVAHSGFWEKLALAPQWPLPVTLGVLSLAFGSTVIAFFLQVRAQAYLSPTVSSLLFLLESPFALIFSLLLLDESLGPFEAAGATIIFVSAMAASLLEARRKRSVDFAPEVLNS
ncbi:MAG: DMT family transporter [Bdellovibrionales bacterium]